MNIETIQQNAVIQHRTICAIKDIIRSNMSSLNVENLKIPFEVIINYLEIDNRLTIKYLEKEYVLKTKIIKKNSIATEKNTICKYCFYVINDRLDSNYIMHKVENETRYSIYMDFFGNIAEDDDFRSPILTGFIDTIKKMLFEIINEYQLE